MMHCCKQSSLPHVHVFVNTHVLKDVVVQKCDQWFYATEELIISCDHIVVCISCPLTFGNLLGEMNSGLFLKRSSCLPPALLWSNPLSCPQELYLFPQQKRAVNENARASQVRKNSQISPKSLALILFILLYRA